MTYHYLRLLVELGFHVTLLPANLVRVEPYTSALQQLGVNVLYVPALTNAREWLRDHAFYFDYACIYRPSIAPDYIDVIREHGLATRTIYYPIDLHICVELRCHGVTGEPKAVASSRRWQAIESSLFLKFDVVHVLSPYEEEVVRQLAPGTTTRTVPAYLFDLEPAAPPIVEHRARRNLLFVGGFDTR